MKKFKIIFEAVFSLSLLLLPVLSLAATTPPPDSATRCTDFKKQFGVTVGTTDINIADGAPFYCNASQVILLVINYGLIMSGSVAILFLMVGGFWYLTSAGSEEQAEKGKKTIINAVVGLVVIILAFTIVKIVSSTLSLGK